MSEPAARQIFLAAWSRRRLKTGAAGPYCEPNEVNKIAVPSSYLRRRWNALSENERVKLELKILRYRRLARQMAADPDTMRRVKELIADLERQLREIDEYAVDIQPRGMRSTS